MMETIMGHIVAKDIYGALGEKIDNLAVRTPQTKAFHAMLRQLYSPDDAELIVGMPFVGSQDAPAMHSNHSAKPSINGTSSELDNGCGVDRYTGISLRLLGKVSRRFF